MERHTGKESLNRRQFINKVGKGLALLTAGYYSRSILTDLSEQEKELSEIRKRTTSIDNAYIDINQYNACQNITSNRCEDIMSPDKLSEVRKAQIIVEQHKGHIAEITKQIDRGNERIEEELLTASYIEAGIGAVALIANKFTKIKVNSKIRQ